MIQFNTLVTKMQRRNRQTRDRMEKLMVQAANSRNQPILHEDLMIVSRQKDLTAAAAILPCHHILPGESQDFAFLYLDLEEMDGLKPGYYIIRLTQGNDLQFRENAKLVDLNGLFVKNCKFLLSDPHEPILGHRPIPFSRTILVDSWIRRGEAYAIEGVLGNGSPFIITLEF